MTSTTLSPTEPPTHGTPPAPPGPTEATLPGPDRPADFRVDPDRIDLWLIRRPPLAEFDTLAHHELDDRERERTAAFARRGDGLLYAAAHIGLRRLLGLYTATSPDKVEFLREPCPGCGEPHGRPAVGPPPPPLHFSLSHSGTLAMVGLATRPIGVDVEKLPGADTVEIASKVLHPDEQAELAATNDDTARRDLFGRIWTRKEAYLKGIGTGLSRSPAKDYLGLDPGRHPEGWTLVRAPCDDAHAGSAAIAGPPPALAELRTLPADWLTADWTPPAPTTPAP
ncbi:4'-phosphopantetheinyl transferase family protein (plasmid) [Streptomyces sp. BI20]|uniref:4'-phosphopantetheinyl transferase family protein n=1 Tax=Streptomyces sp. BI20 TaxID=3403460 RepID=UPI003C722FD4